MNNLILQLLPILLLIILYVFIFSRRGEVQRAKVGFKSHDWFTYFGVILAAVVLAQAVMELGINLPLPWWTAILVLFFLFLIIVVIRRARTGKPLLQRMGDERVNIIYAKSARNALFTTYLAFFVHLLISDAHTIDTIWLVIVLGSGLLVLIASTIFYLYQKS